jgi:type IV pilus assembly protein PilP
MINNELMLLLLTSLLFGCNANQDSIDEYFQRAESKAYEEIEHLAPMTHFRTSVYQVGEIRDPFSVPVNLKEQAQTLAKSECWQPDTRLRREQLERYPLSKLKLKGMMSREKRALALIETPSGQVVKVGRGEFIGLNSGQITHVTSKYLQLKETIPDGMGCWSRRSVRLALK